MKILPFFVTTVNMSSCPIKGTITAISVQLLFVTIVTRVINSKT